MSVSGRFLLIAALSGRAIAESARRAGFVPLVADLFADADTRDIAAAAVRVAGSLARGLGRASLLRALDELAAGRAIAGLVYGSGFESRPRLLADVAARFPLLGNPPSVVSAVKDPLALAALCARLGISHPRTRAQDPEAEGWIAKVTGASGGGHVVLASSARSSPRRYFQRLTDGLPYSIAFVADGRRARVLALTRQWTDPTRRHPFRYGGVVRPGDVAPVAQAAMHDAVAAIVPATGLRGLNGADFLVRPDGVDLLEINPRPCATLDVIDDGDGAPIELHLLGCAGTVPAAVPMDTVGAAAAAVVYAPRATEMPTGFVWPDWACDRQTGGTAVMRGGPVCTVRARASSAATAEALVRERARAIRRILSPELKDAA